MTSCRAKVFVVGMAPLSSLLLGWLMLTLPGSLSVSGHIWFFSTAIIITKRANHLHFTDLNGALAALQAPGNRREQKHLSAGVSDCELFQPIDCAIRVRFRTTRQLTRTALGVLGVTNKTARM